MTSRLHFVTFVAVVGGLSGVVAQGCGRDEALPRGLGGGLIGDDGGGPGPGRDARPPASRSNIGAPCLEDADCPGSGLFCLTQESDELFGGGPQGGICVADCTEDPDTCQDIDANAVCVSGDGIALCLEGCVPGDPLPGEVKCRDRLDVACFSENGFTGYCGPTCTDDFSCAPRVCDLGSGVCVDPDQLREGLEIGSECDPDADTDPCQGFCVAMPNGNGMCSGLCNLSTVGCGADPSSPDPYDAMCWWVPSVDLSFGDPGFCGQLCDCNDDCLHPDMLCSAFPSGFMLEEGTGRVGFCSPNAAEDGGVGIPCEGRPDAGPGDANSDAALPDSGGDAPSQGPDAAPDAGAAREDAGADSSRAPDAAPPDAGGGD